jgi:hypothetical protein
MQNPNTTRFRVTLEILSYRNNTADPARNKIAKVSGYV